MRAPLAHRGWWTWLGAAVSPMLIAVTATFAVAMAMLHEVARVVRRSQEVRHRAGILEAHIAAEGALVRRAAAAADEIAPPPVAVATSIEEGADAVLVEVRLPDGATHWFEGHELNGAAPMAFGNAFGSTSAEALARISGGSRLDPTSVPRFDGRALAGAVRADTLPAFRRDQGVALMHWQVGTDGDDFVLGRGRRIDGLAAMGNLIVVPGHLWIEPCPAPLEIHLRSDVVIVVRGNLYVGRSLRVVGGGRLLLATTIPDGASAFADRDCNGRWSAGDVVLGRAAFTGQVEGGGNVYIGHAGSGARIECDAGLFVSGELHARVDSRVSGPLLLAHGVTFAAAAARVCAAGEWRFRPDRERVPGFATTGPARPSLLRYSGDRRPAVPKQTLYLSVPAR